MFVKTAGGIGSFNPKDMADTHFAVVSSAVQTASAGPAMHVGVLLGVILTVIVGFFATAGAAGVDFGTNSRNTGDVKMGGLVGVALAIVLTAGLSALIVAGVHGTPEYSKEVAKNAKAAVATAVAKVQNDTSIDKDKMDEALEKASVDAATPALYRTTELMGVVLGDKLAKILMFLLALAAFPPACFSSFIAANSIRTTLPKVNPFISVGIGAVISIALAISGKAGDAVGVFKIIGASFGPICGAMMVDYLLSGGNWTGPRAGFNPAGWIAWALGFIVGILPSFDLPVPAAPVAAFVVGAVVYFLCAKLGMLSSVVPLTQPATPATAAQ
jgi:cytosine permease